MHKKELTAFEKKIKELGNTIAEWRCDESSRHLIDPNQFKTKADYEASKLLTKIILDHYPNSTIISEEDAIHNEERPNSYWIIDPIDGTASWYNGFPGFVTQLAYVENEIVLYSIICAPILNKIWTANKGHGAYLNGELIPELTETTRFNLIDNYPNPNCIAKKIYENFKVDKYIECGSIGLKACLVADGTADLFIKDVIFRDWDIAPASLILSEVNGQLTDLAGNKIHLSGPFVKKCGLLVSARKSLNVQITNFITTRSLLTNKVTS